MEKNLTAMEKREDLKRKMGFIQIRIFIFNILKRMMTGYFVVNCAPRQNSLKREGVTRILRVTFIEFIKLNTKITWMTRS